MSRSLRSEVFNREIVSFRSCVTCVRAGEAKQRAGVRRSESVAGVVGTNISCCCSSSCAPVATGRRISLTKYEREAAPDPASRYAWVQILRPVTRGSRSGVPRPESDAASRPWSGTRETIEILLWTHDLMIVRCGADDSSM